MSVKKLTAKVPAASGIYEIRCLQNQKFYVGSALNLRQRWCAHRRSLQKRAHHNSHLQHAWNLHGQANFEFSVLELVKTGNLLRREQAWIEQTRCTNREIGFNISELASCGGETIPLVWHGFRDPSGKPVTIANLTAFCRRNALDFPSMHRLSKGISKLKSYKGWTHQNSVRRRDYIKSYDGFVDPNGRTVPTITNLAAFCREHGLDKTHLVAVAHGRITSYRGWTSLNGRSRQPPKEHTGFVAPGGAFTIITNLSAFCKACNLCVAHMHEVKSGRRPSHKGWTWRDHDPAQIAEWRGSLQTHESPGLRNEPLSPTSRA